MNQISEHEPMGTAGFTDEHRMFDEANITDTPAKGVSQNCDDSNFTAEELAYRATCRESYDIMYQTLAVYAQYPEARYHL